MMAEYEEGFEGLVFYRDSLVLVKAAYRAADTFPTHERFALADQLRRASSSISLNIAEGYGRYHYLDRLRFMYIARGSLNETLSAFIVANTVGYVDDEQIGWVREIADRIERNLNGYCKFIRHQAQGQSEFGKKIIKEDGADYAFE